MISLLADAVTDAAAAGGPADRALRAERELESAGIGPDHPSLYAGRGGRATMPAELYLGVPLAVVAGLRSLWSP